MRPPPFSIFKWLRIPDEYAEILRGLPDTAENPFYWRERRRDGRRGEPFRGLLNAAMLLAMFFGMAWAGLWALLYLGAFPDSRIPGWLGEQDGGRAIFAIVAAIHGLIVYSTSRGVMNRVLSAEASRGTLLQILMSRVGTFEMLAGSTVYPFQLAMTAAIAGLPLYFFLVSLKSVGIQEVFVFYLLLALLAIPVPVWRTPGFGEQSPEEVGQVLRDQAKSAGCLAWLLVVVGLPGSMMLGAAFAGLHYVWPQFAGRIPADVWPALVAFPMTGMWVIVRALCAPYTWFGIPAPPWTWLLPVALLYRVSALWTSSIWLRVSSAAQIPSLPDTRRELAFRRRIRTLGVVGLVGAMWQPLAESTWTSNLYVAAPQSGDHLASLVYWLGAIGLVLCLFRLGGASRRYGSLKELSWWRRLAVFAPFWPLCLGIAAAMLAWAPGIMQPEESVTSATLTTLAGIILISAGAIASADALSADVSALMALWVLPATLLFLPAPWSWLSALSPAVALLAINPAAQAAASPPLHLPPLLVGLAGPIVVAVLLQFARGLGWVHRSFSARAVVVRPATPINVSPTPPPVRQPVGAHGYAAQAVLAGPDLDFVIDGAEPLAAPPVVHARRSMPPRPAPPPLPLPPARDWRLVPMSSLAQAVMRYVVSRTDNPVAIYGARRVLPGTLGSDQAAVGVACGLLGLLVAWAAPAVLLAFVLPVAFHPLLFRGPEMRMDDPGFGFALLITTLASFTLFAPMLACANVTRAFRMERDRSTLGFLLMTPLKSVSVVAGHIVGAAIPALAFWASAALLGFVSALILAAKGYVDAALGGWTLGFGTSLLYLALSVVTGAWIGVCEQKAHDMTIGIYLLPASICGLGIAAAFYFWLNRGWSYPACVALFLAIVTGFLIYMWRSTVGELQKLRHGDVPFEGRVAS